jgi:hypothetical protein
MRTCVSACSDDAAPDLPVLAAVVQPAESTRCVPHRYPGAPGAGSTECPTVLKVTHPPGDPSCDACSPKGSVAASCSAAGSAIQPSNKPCNLGSCRIFKTFSCS